MDGFSAHIYSVVVSTLGELKTILVNNNMTEGWKVAGNHSLLHQELPLKACMHTQFYALQMSASIGRTMAISPYMWPHSDPCHIAIIYTYAHVMASTLAIPALAVHETHMYIHACNNCNIYKHIYNFSNNF